MKFKYRQNLPAFSLLEIIVVLMIISVGLLGVLNLMVSSSRAQNSNRETLIAYNLAQEALELVRNVRDTNWREGAAWNLNITGSPSGEKYKVDFRHFQPVPINNIKEATLQMSSSSNQWFYIHDASSSDSIFRRMITITADDASSSSSTVSCLVEWNDRGDTRRFELQTELYDWR